MRPTGMPVQSGHDRGDRLLVDAAAGSAASRPAASSSCACSSRSSASSACALVRRRRRPPARRRRPSARRPPAPACCRCLRPARSPARSFARRSPGSRRPARFSAFQRSSSAARASSLAARASRSTPCVALADVDADRLLAADDLQLGLAAPRCAAGSPRPRPASACWLMATRAQAVSSRLTALSGSWRAGM